MTTTDTDDTEQHSVPNHILALITDAHAHPTDDPRLSGPDGIPTLARRITDEVKIGRVCAMSSNTADQVLVRELKREVDSLGGSTGLDFRACFGERQLRLALGEGSLLTTPLHTHRLPSMVFSHHLARAPTADV